MRRHIHNRRSKNWLFALLIALLSAGCVPVAQPRIATPTSVSTLAAAAATPLPPTTATAAVTATPLPTQTPTSIPTPTPATLTGAGDIVECGYDGAAQTAALLEKMPGAIFTAGDNSNDSGRQVEYKNCFGPTWGQFLDRIHPVPGNHDYNTDDGQPYYQYFGAAAGEPGKGWYSYDLGAWHIVALNSNCDAVNCREDSEQLNWLRQDLQSHPALCTLAYYHLPRWSSGQAGNAGWIAPIFDTLYENSVDMVVNGNDHEYERIAPLDPEGALDLQHGVRSFVVGTGGAGLRSFSKVIAPGSEERIADTFGVIQFKLYPDHYEWAFLPVGGGPALDSGRENCR